MFLALVSYSFQCFIEMAECKNKDKERLICKYDVVPFE